MSLDPSGCCFKATQASAASSQTFPLLATEFQQDPTLKSNAKAVNLLQNAQNASKSLRRSRENPTTSSEESADTVKAVSESDERKMGNRQSAKKEQNSKSEDKGEEGEVWIKRDDIKISKDKNEEKRKKKKRKNKHKTDGQKQNETSAKHTTVATIVTHKNGAEQSKCLPGSYGVAGVAEVDRWAGFKMADEYSSSSAGYQTPEARTPILSRQSKPGNTTNLKNQGKSTNENKSNRSEITIKPTVPPLANKTQVKSEISVKSIVINPKKEPLKKKEKEITEPLKKKEGKREITEVSIIPKTAKDHESNSDVVSKSEALAKLDSLSNSPRSQRRHGVLLPKEVAKYIPLPPEAEIVKTTAVNHTSVMVVEKSPVVVNTTKQKTPSGACSGARNKEGVTKRNAVLLSDSLEQKKSTDLAFCEKSSNISTNGDVGQWYNETSVKVIEPSNESAACNNVLRDSTIEIMEDNLANELREASTETENIEAPGPGVAVLACIPPPEKALITQVPPPSPSSIAVFEEDEEEDCEVEEKESERKSKEMEVFSDTVCQRLSLLLETEELLEDTIDDSVESLSGEEEQDMTFDKNEKPDGSYCTESGSESSDDEFDENDYVQGSDSYEDYSDEIDYTPDDLKIDVPKRRENVPDEDDFGVDIPKRRENVTDVDLDLAKTPGGINDATPFDLMNNNYSIPDFEEVSLLDPPGGAHKEPISGSVTSSSDLNTDEMDDFDPPGLVIGRRDMDLFEEDIRFDREERQSAQNRAQEKRHIFAKHDSKRKFLKMSSSTSSSTDSREIDSFVLSKSEVKVAKQIPPVADLSNSRSDHIQKVHGNKSKDSKSQASSNIPTLDSNNATKRSRLDESLKALFKIPKMEENYAEMEPLQHLLESDFDTTPTSDTQAAFEAIAALEEDRKDGRFCSRRRSLGCTESSDLDISEQRDDLSTDSMLADDEEEGEVLFSRTYPEPSGGEVLISCTVVNSAVRYDNADDFWDEVEPEEEICVSKEPDVLASDAFVDINDSDFDNARKQMQDIQKHLRNLKHQMDSLTDDVGAASCAPGPHSDDDSESEINRRAMTD